MIAGGWSFVWAAYAVTAAALITLIVVIVLRAAYWSRKARALEKERKA